MDLATDTAPRSHRPYESQQHYEMRLRRAKFWKAELAELNDLYDRLDAERAAQNLPPAPRDHREWTKADILEWRDLKPFERYLSLNTIARATDRAANPLPRTAVAQPTLTPRILNRTTYARQLPADAVYIGRGSKWGNPFVIGRDGSREDVVAKHEHWLSRQNELLKSIDELKGRNLVCFCSPLPCHGNILLKLANASRDDRIAWWKQMRVAH